MRVALCLLNLPINQSLTHIHALQRIKPLKDLSFQLPAEHQTLVVDITEKLHILRSLWKPKTHRILFKLMLRKQNFYWWK